MTRPMSPVSVPGAATATIFSPWMATSQSPTPQGVTTCPPLNHIIEHRHIPPYQAQYQSISAALPSPLAEEQGAWSAYPERLRSGTDHCPLDPLPERGMEERDRCTQNPTRPIPIEGEDSHRRCAPGSRGHSSAAVTTPPALSASAPSPPTSRRAAPGSGRARPPYAPPA